MGMSNIALLRIRSGNHQWLRYEIITKLLDTGIKIQYYCDFKYTVIRAAP